MNCQISSFSSLTPTCWPVWLVVTVNTEPQRLSSVGFVCRSCNVNCVTTFRGRFFWWWLLSCDVDHCRSPHPPTPSQKMWYSLVKYVFVGYKGFGGEIISPVSIWPSLCWLQWIKRLKTTLSVLTPLYLRTYNDYIINIIFFKGIAINRLVLN